MTRQKPHVQIEIKQFIEDSKKLVGKDYPKRVSRAFKLLARKARNEVREETKRDFDLKTQFIPKGILSTPNSPAQEAAGARSVEKYHDIEAAVFIRPASDPKKGLEFMVNHETGMPKTGHGGMIAVPAQDLGNYAYKTARGKTKKAFKPATLLEDYNRLGGNTKGNKLRKGKRGGKGVAFIKKFKGGNTMIVRRKTIKSSSLEFLYSFKKVANIRPVWGFESTVNTTVRRVYKSIVTKELRKL